MSFSFSRQSKELIVIKPWRVAYARVPKVANTSIKDALREALERPTIRGLPATRDRYWSTVDKAVVDVVTPLQFASDQAYSRYFCFGVVRTPTSRMVSRLRSKPTVHPTAEQRRVLERRYGSDYQLFYPD